MQVKQRRNTMNDITRYAFIGIMLFLIISWFSIIFAVIKHDSEVNNMAQKYKEENELLKEEIKDMQERINALLNITETNEIDWME